MSDRRPYRHQKPTVRALGVIEIAECPSLDRITDAFVTEDSNAVSPSKIPHKLHPRIPVYHIGISAYPRKITERIHEVRCLMIGAHKFVTAMVLCPFSYGINGFYSVIRNNTGFMWNLIHLVIIWG